MQTGYFAQRHLTHLVGFGAAVAAAVGGKTGALPEAADAAPGSAPKAPKLPTTARPVIEVTAVPAPGSRRESDSESSRAQQQQATCSFNAYLAPTPGPPGLYEIDYKGQTSCTFPTVLTGVATLYKHGRPLDEAPPCSTLGTVCLSADGVTGAIPAPYRTGYKGTATAPPGKVWAPTPGCTGAGTPTVTCVASSGTYNLP